MSSDLPLCVNTTFRFECLCFLIHHSGSYAPFYGSCTSSTFAMNFMRSIAPLSQSVGLQVKHRLGRLCFTAFSPAGLVWGCSWNLYHGNCVTWACALAAWKLHSHISIFSASCCLHGPGLLLICDRLPRWMVKVTASTTNYFQQRANSTSKLHLIFSDGSLHFHTFFHSNNFVEFALYGHVSFSS